METRVPAQHLFRNIFRFWIAILALVLLFAGFPGTSALAANPYKFTDQCEGDPGDGVLNPRAKEELDLSAGDLDENLIFEDRGYFVHFDVGEAERIDLTASQELRDAIGEFDPAMHGVDIPVE